MLEDERDKICDAQPNGVQDVELSPLQRHALRNGAPAELLPQFTNRYQVFALQYNVTAEDALKFTNGYQVTARRNGATIEEALAAGPPAVDVGDGDEIASAGAAADLQVDD